MIFDAHIVVDWSARSAPSPRAASGDAIWWAAVGPGLPAAPVYARTRHAAIEDLTALAAQLADRGSKVLIGFDFPFGYPRGVAAHVTGRAEARAMWDWLAARVNDAPDNSNTRYAAATALNRLYPGCGPCWGHPTGWDVADVPARKSSRTMLGHPPERRHADARAKGAKTVWQMAYAGAVGCQVLLGQPTLARMTADPRLAGRVAVWPFDGGFGVPDAPICLAEVYPSQLAPAIAARRHQTEKLDSAQVRVTAAALAALDRAGGLRAVFGAPPDLDLTARREVETEEAWILGIGHQARLLAALEA